MPDSKLAMLQGGQRKLAMPPSATFRYVRFQSPSLLTGCSAHHSGALAQIGALHRGSGERGCSDLKSSLSLFWRFMAGISLGEGRHSISFSVPPFPIISRLSPWTFRSFILALSRTRRSGCNILQQTTYSSIFLFSRCNLLQR